MKYKYLSIFSSLYVSLIPSVDAQTTELFNGENLDGWTVFGTEKWYVEDGEIICESGPDEKYGYLATDEYYDNFELTFEFKQEATVTVEFFRSTVEGTKISGWQVEVAPQKIIQEVFTNPTVGGGL